MALSSATSKLTPVEVWRSRRRDENARVSSDEFVDQDDELADLTDEEREEFEISRYCLRLLSDGVEARRAFETFDEAWDTLHNNIWPRNYPKWRARININKIRSLVLFIQAVMTDNKPRITVDPAARGSENAADILSKVVERDWDENDMQDKLSLSILYGIIFGTGIFKIWYDPYGNNGKGAHKASPIVPYRVYVNRTATCVEDAEYIVHVEEVSMGWLRRNFPDRADLCEEYVNTTLTSRPRADRDLVREGFDSEESELDNPIQTATNYTVPADKMHTSRGPLNDDTIEYGEFWYRDDEMEDYSRQVVLNGVPQMEDATDDFGLPVRELAGYQVRVSPLDGTPYVGHVYQTKQVPKMEIASRMKFPNGRLTQMAGPVVLRDIPNPYQISGFPFASWKCVDFGPFWGQGLPLILKDIQIGIIRLVSQGYEIMEKTGNPSYKYKKGSGLNVSSIKNKAGTLIPLDDLDALVQIPGASMPSGFVELVNMLKQFLGEVAAVQDSVMGALQGGNVAFATIDQLQESGAAPIRAMVRNMEKMLKRIGVLRIQLAQQYDNGERPLRQRVEQPPATFTDPETGEVLDVVQPPDTRSTAFKTYTNADLQGIVDYGVVPDSSLSTSPAGKWNRYMSMFDKKLIDRQEFLTAMKIDNRDQILKRMAQAEMAAAAAKGKPGPKPSKPPRSGTRKPPPSSHVPTRLENNAVR